MNLADSRTLDALDFASVRERVVSATRTQRGRAYAAQLAPELEFARSRREQARTEAMRSLAAGADVTIMPAIETSSFTEAAAIGRALGPAELRAVGDALARRGGRASRRPGPSGFRGCRRAVHALRELQRRILDALDERGAVLDRASPALDEFAAGSPSPGRRTRSSAPSSAAQIR